MTEVRPEVVKGVLKGNPLAAHGLPAWQRSAVSSSSSMKSISSDSPLRTVDRKDLLPDGSSFHQLAELVEDGADS